ncbi:hypothetical protein BH09PSE5_BH09PSE5_13980 [soil metagenome]
MSLATRCTQCGTVFRVVQDQLKVSEGWVRCGRCDEVFNALEGLFDLERDSPPALPVAAAESLVSTREEWQPSGRGGLQQPALPAPLSRGNTPAPQRPREQSRDHSRDYSREHTRELGGPSNRPGALARDRGQNQFDRQQTHPTRPSQFGPPSGFDSPFFQPVDGPHSAPAPLGAASGPGPMPLRAPESVAAAAHESDAADTRVDFADARFNSELLVDPETRIDPAARNLAQAEALAVAQQTKPAPAFVRAAESAERWQSPLVRASLTMLALVLMLGFALQYVHHNRNMVAAKWPGMEPMLAQWCAMAGCTIEAPQNIADVRIESSALTPAPASASSPTASAVTLSVVLRNHGETKVALPSIDVTLTDNAGKMLSRRSLSPADFGIADAVLATGAESTLQAVLSTGERKAAGYTVDVFYP